MPVLGLGCCAQAFSVVAPGRGYSLWQCGSFSLQGLLLLWSASSRARLSSCGAWALLPRSMWDLPGPGAEPLPLHYHWATKEVQKHGFLVLTSAAHILKHGFLNF